MAKHIMAKSKIVVAAAAPITANAVVATALADTSYGVITSKLNKRQRSALRRYWRHAANGGDGERASGDKSIQHAHGNVWRAAPLPIALLARIGCEYTAVNKQPAAPRKSRAAKRLAAPAADVSSDAPAADAAA